MLDLIGGAHSLWQFIVKHSSTMSTSQLITMLELMTTWFIVGHGRNFLPFEFMRYINHLVCKDVMRDEYLKLTKNINLLEKNPKTKIVL